MTTIWQKIKRKLGKLKSQPNHSEDSEPTSMQQKHEKTSDINNTHTSINNDFAKKDSKYTLSKHSAKESSQPITDRIAAYLTAKDWKFTHFPPKNSSKSSVHHLSLGMQSDDMEWGYLFRINEDNKLLSVYGVLPFSLSPAQISAGVALATQINYDLMIGNIEIDLRDGEVRFKNAIDTECIKLDDSILDYLTQSVTAMTHVIYQLFYDLHQGKGTQTSLEELLTQIQEANHTHTYFVATESIQ
ncbi:YbjN domain-containing protein [Psychrobacter sp. I-STPA10]|uniref:YbjN domain-containing protein n=1 Tax=Psychrobacter sp. I-STPA10 TaxID=2585769 RepID=UPI001E3DEB5B|nr:YbjN domain-containing protein [Psychrobacter sp. I-STPA10]